MGVLHTPVWEGPVGGQLWAAEGGSRKALQLDGLVRILGTAQQAGTPGAAQE